MDKGTSSKGHESKLPSSDNSFLHTAIANSEVQKDHQLLIYDASQSTLWDSIFHVDNQDYCAMPIAVSHIFYRQLNSLYLCVTQSNGSSPTMYIFVQVKIQSHHQAMSFMRVWWLM